MQRWLNRVAVVTGASSGIGAAVAKDLANNGMIVVGLARRVERVESLRDEVKADARDRIHAIKCDVRKEDEIVATFQQIITKFGPIAVLVNNAGIVRSSDLAGDNNSEDLRDILATNVLGVAIATREAFRSMKENGGDGHVVIINSIAGHQVPFTNNSISIYPASKHAITAMTESYRQEFFRNNTKVKVTSISPGCVDTEVFTEDMRPYITEMPLLKASDVSDALIYCLGTPPHVQIPELTIRPMGEAF
ncbi:PREDICTED: farnesol dehydrogenase-like [Rhagoletis zephyria]|uniref:farnesol dehydrogenase-like n=1 Tax=Rhagoletis zephyria TaxID=28612 RepID=UPI0008118CC3|nr:PREDICTED: farnesol dehydrogenase-like [Rhagoletis zephyria]